MAGNAESRQARRLSVRAATEPLPSPLPPPARQNRPVSASEIEPHVPNYHSAPQVPPPPHFLTRFPAIDAAQFQTEPTTGACPERSLELPHAPAEKPVPERSLASPGVLLSLAASVAVMCAIGWYERHGIDGFKWDTIERFVQRLSIEPADPEEDLPYITAIPMTPNSISAAPIAEDEPRPATKSNQVVLSDLLRDEAAGTSDDDRTQIR